MNPKLCKRLGLPGVHSRGKALFRSVPVIENLETSKEAALLLSIADICQSEIQHSGSNLWRDDLTLPSFPYLSDDEDEDHHQVVPKLPERKVDSLYSFMSTPIAAEQFYPANRIRSVSLDQSPKPMEPTVLPSADVVLSTPVVSTRPPTRAYRQHNSSSHNSSPRLIIKMKKDLLQEARPCSPHDAPKSKRSKPLQGVPPKGQVGKKIGRRKFSWKNYPELEHFLIANRDEYLKHSALNYTVQQKSYNNRLTERLLELATEHGYIFDEVDFNFVTVRDRIRCYYKSFVQSAKKRGVLLGYAARQAGLLSEDELVELSMDDGDIVMPSP